MNALATHRRLLPAAYLCAVTVMLSGCVSYPKIVDKPWEYVQVVYLARDENGRLRPQSWETRDPLTMTYLWAAFPKNGICFLMPVGRYSLVNRVDIKLRGDKWWSLSYTRPAGEFGGVMTAHDPFGSGGTFLLGDCRQEVINFHTALTNEIMRETGIAVDLDANNWSSEELDELYNSKNSANYYRLPSLDQRL